MVIDRWKLKLSKHLGPRDDRLTNVRFADDLIIYANSSDELAEMLEALFAELAVVGW